METLIIKDITNENMEKAGEIIRNGGLVAFPTETVYGLGASVFSDNALKNIYKAKGRPSDNPLIVHVASIADAEKVAEEIPENARKMFIKFAPGPFTLILKKRPEISHIVTAGLSTVGVRIPENEVCRKFLECAKVPVAAPSANISGKPSPTKAEHVIEDMNGKIDAIIASGDSSVGVESTIIDMTADIPTILRPGKITIEDVISVCGAARYDEHILKSLQEGEAPKCPGMKYRHYAPDADVTVVEGEHNSVCDKIKELAAQEKKKGKKVGVLAVTDEGFDADLFLSTGATSEAFAKNLFGALRKFDEEKIDVVFAEFSFSDSYGMAVKNRLYKSAGHNIIYVKR